MRVADELREWANEHLYKSGIRSDLLAIADRIDEEHARIVHQKVNKAHADGEQSAIRQLRSASEDHRRGYQLGHEKAMQEVEQTHVALPLDADGVPIRVGDVMELDGEPFEVRRIELDESGEWTMRDRLGTEHLCAYLYRHHHPPTVEDELREMLVSMECSGGLCDTNALIAEYAAKLQLKEDE